MAEREGFEPPEPFQVQRFSRPKRPILQTSLNRSKSRLLNYFWQVHNPTQIDGQGNDHGAQYRSIILYANAAQKAAAEKSRDAAAKVFRDPIVTQIVPLEKFWPAEKYHQDYFAKNPTAGYCQFVIAPKIKKLEHALEAGKK